MNNKDSLGDRMKGYENISRIYLTKRSPVIIRIDGKAFHNFTRGFRRPFDRIFMETMKATATYLCENISGCKLAYTQSDEISLLLTDYDTIDTQPWFENNLQKLVSVSASMATVAFNKNFNDNVGIHDQMISEIMRNMSNEDLQKAEDYLRVLRKASDKLAVFDARAFVLPKDEVCNYFIWRQQDATRNSIQIVGQANFSHSELQGKNCSDIQDMLMLQRQINWNCFRSCEKRGTCIVKKQVDLGNGLVRNKWIIDDDIPIFTQYRKYIDKLVYGDDYEKNR